MRGQEHVQNENKESTYSSMKTVANSPYFVMIVLRKRLHKKQDAKGEGYYEENMVERSGCLSNLST